MSRWREPAPFDGGRPASLIAAMSDGIIDIRQYLQDGDEDEDEGARGAFALWGADGERSRFALPLWRIIYLARGDRGAIVSEVAGGERILQPFVVLDLFRDPPRIAFDAEAVPRFGGVDAPSLHDAGQSGLAVNLGSRGGRTWSLLVDGGGERGTPLEARAREDILSLAGECAGLLFLRDLANEAE
jgi:hypothetical protein